jgi:CHAD domain-containing protein
LLKQIGDAANRLRTDRTLTDVDVHEARKSIKRARAVLKLLRPALEEDEVARSRVSLRDAGRALASARDAKVMAERFTEVLDRVGMGAFTISTINGRDSVAKRSRSRAGSGRRVAAASARACLQRARQRLQAAPLAAAGRTTLDDGLRAIYRSGRRDLPRDASAASTEAMHEWRKRLKDYQYALEVLAAPEHLPLVRRTIGSARRLADALGEEHDLALLADALRASDCSEDPRVTELLAAIRLRRRRLRRRALKLGAVLYAESPAVMVRKLRHRK